MRESEIIMELCDQATGPDRRRYLNGMLNRIVKARWVGSTGGNFTGVKLNILVTTFQGWPDNKGFVNINLTGCRYRCADPGRKC